MTSDNDSRSAAEPLHAAGDDSEFVELALARLESVEVSAQLARRVAAIAIQHPREEAWTWRRLWQPALVLGLSGMMGVVSGAWTAAPLTEESGQVVQSASSGAGIDDLWLEAWDLAWGSSYSAADDSWDLSGSTDSELSLPQQDSAEPRSSLNEPDFALGEKEGQER